MTKPILLDLFCCAGGAAEGYRRAGFEVVGVDINPQPNYPFEFIQGDALEFLRKHGADFDAIHASPPCQKYSLAAAGGARRSENHADLVGATRVLLQSIGRPYVIENVPQAPLLQPATLCGTQFGLPIIRHRSFESSMQLDTPPDCGYKATARVRHKGYVAYPYARKAWGPAWREHVLPVVWPWMTLQEAGQAIPPAYTEYIGKQLLAVLAEEEVRDPAA